MYVLVELPWLPISWRGKCNQLVLEYTIFHGLTQGCIQNLILPYSRNDNLQSADLRLLVVNINKVTSNLLRLNKRKLTLSKKIQKTPLHFHSSVIEQPTSYLNKMWNSF